MTTNTTTLAPAATISEKELWALFVTHTMKSTFSMGPTVELYRPDDLIRDPGSYGGIAHYSGGVANSVEVSEEPLEELAISIVETADYLANLKRVHDDFSRLKLSLLVADNEVDEGDEEQPARFQRPVIEGEAA